MNLRQAVTNNIGVKLMALVVALFIWFHASGQQSIMRVVDIPLKLQNLPDSVRVQSAVPETIEISLTGTKRDVLRVRMRRNLAVAVDLSGSAPGRERVNLSPMNVVLPSGFDRRNVRILSPMTLDLTMEALIERRVPITLATSGKISNELVLLDGSISLAPSWVTVRGPKSVIENMRSVSTEPFDLSKVKESVTRPVGVRIPVQGIVASPSEVSLSIRVSPKSKRMLANLPPTVLLDSEDLVADVVPSTVTLTLEGAASVLDSLSSGDVSVLLNLSGKPASEYRLAPEVILPPGVALAAMSVDTVTVRVFPPEALGAP